MVAVMNERRCQLGLNFLPICRKGKMEEHSLTIHHGWLYAYTRYTRYVYARRVSVRRPRVSLVSASSDRKAVQVDVITANTLYRVLVTGCTEDLLLNRRAIDASLHKLYQEFVSSKVAHRVG